LLQELYQLFDHCSQMIHNSVYSMAGNFSFRREDTQQHVQFNVFDLPDGPVVAAALYFTADSGRRRTGFRGEREKRSGVKTNTIPG